MNRSAGQAGIKRFLLSSMFQLGVLGSMGGAGCQGIVYSDDGGWDASDSSTLADESPAPNESPDGTDSAPGELIPDAGTDLGQEAATESIDAGVDLFADQGLERQRPRPPLPEVTSQEVSRGGKDRPWIALTFDAGADAAPAQSILDTLLSKNLYATFFLTGDWIRANPYLLDRIIQDDHELANHSDTHPDFTTLTDEQIRTELGAVETAMAAKGLSSKPYFRPPYGARDGRVRTTVAGEGYLTIYWTYHVWDWETWATADTVYNYAIEGACNGAVVVMHIGSAATASALPRIIDELQNRGFRLVTLSEVLAASDWEP